MRQSERLRTLIVPATRRWCAIIKLAHDDPQADVDQVKFLAMLRSLLLGGE